MSRGNAPVQTGPSRKSPAVFYCASRLNDLSCRWLIVDSGVDGQNPVISPGTEHRQRRSRHRPRLTGHPRPHLPGSQVSHLTDLRLSRSHSSVFDFHDRDRGLPAIAGALCRGHESVESRARIARVGKTHVETGGTHRRPGSFANEYLHPGMQSRNRSGEHHRVVDLWRQHIGWPRYQCWRFRCSRSAFWVAFSTTRHSAGEGCSENHCHRRTHSPRRQCSRGTPPPPHRSGSRRDRCTRSSR